MPTSRRPPRPRLLIVVPALNEAQSIGGTLEALEPMRRRGAAVVLVDGGSTDGTPALARPLVDRVVSCGRGRARQMNAGAAAMPGEVLWFLHADTRTPARADQAIAEALAAGHGWGRFDVRLSGRHLLLRVVERMMNLRSCVSGLATGDQGIFVTRAEFEAVGGFPEIPLMEDLALSRALRRRQRPCCLRQRLVTSSRRWERDGVLRTIVLMWLLRGAWSLGVDPARLHRIYYGRG